MENDVNVTDEELEKLCLSLGPRVEAILIEAAAFAQEWSEQDLDACQRTINEGLRMFPVKLYEPWAYELQEKGLIVLFTNECHGDPEYTIRFIVAEALHFFGKRNYVPVHQVVQA